MVELFMFSNTKAFADSNTRPLSQLLNMLCLLVAPQVLQHHCETVFFGSTENWCTSRFLAGYEALVVRRAPTFSCIFSSSWWHSSKQNLCCARGIATTGPSLRILDAWATVLPSQMVTQFVLSAVNIELRFFNFSTVRTWLRDPLQLCLEAKIWVSVTFRTEA